MAVAPAPRPYASAGSVPKHTVGGRVDTWAMHALLPCWGTIGENARLLLGRKKQGFPCTSSVAGKGDRGRQRSHAMYKDRFILFSINSLPGVL